MNSSLWVPLKNSKLFVLSKGIVMKLSIKILNLHSYKDIEVLTHG